MNDFSRGVKKVTMLFLFCFVGLIGYIAYFQVFKAPSFSEIGSEVGSTDSRDLEEREKILRGTIYDINGEVIAESVRDEDGIQDRKYPFKDLYGAVIGYYGTRYGQSGVESSLDKYLKEYDNKSNTKGFSLNAYFEAKKEEKKANSVITTLNTELQKVAYQAMEDATYRDENYNLKGFDGSVVAMNPKTGEIYVMLSKPSYDANDLDALMAMANDPEADQGALLNKATDAIYPPGSIFKTLTLATAIEKNPSVVTRKFIDPGYLDFVETFVNNGKVDDSKTEEEREEEKKDHYILYNYDSHPPKAPHKWDEGDGTVSAKYAYRYSSNVVFATLGVEIGEVPMKDAAERYGFNEPIKGIGVNAVASNFPLVNSYGDIGQCAIGQHQVSATPLQMAMVGCAVVNDGKLMKPKLIKSVVDSEGEVVKEIEPEVMYEGVVSPETSKEMRAIMRGVVEANEVSPSYPNFHGFVGTNAGGKTGTADWIDPETGEESSDPHGWFLAAAPMDDPEIVVAVLCEKGHGGAQPGAYVSAKIISTYMNKK